MEELRELSWMNHMARGKVIGEFGYARFRVAILSLPPANGDERFVYRMMFFEGASNRPCYAISLERTLLGSWIISEQAAGGSSVLEHLPLALGVEAFNEKALALAGPRLEALQAEQASRTAKPSPRRSRKTK